MMFIKYWPFTILTAIAFFFGEYRGYERGYGLGKEDTIMALTDKLIKNAEFTIIYKDSNGVITRQSTTRFSAKVEVGKTNETN